MNVHDRISYDTNASAAVQAEVTTVLGRLESLLAWREAQVSAAMADFYADGVSEEYRAVELCWRRSSDEVRGIVAMVRTVLQRNDETAASAAARARAAVLDIG